MLETIITNRCILRKAEKEDCFEIYKILNDSDVIENLNMEIHEDIEDTRKMIDEYLIGYKEREKYPFCIVDKKTESFIGVFLIKLDLYDEDCFEFTIYLNKNFWGKGIYSEVLPFMTRFAFEKVKTGNFRGFVMEKNKASSKVLLKNNFKLEKVFEVPGIEGKIESYLMTKEQYEKNKC